MERHRQPARQFIQRDHGIQQRNSRSHRHGYRLCKQPNSHVRLHYQPHFAAGLYGFRNGHIQRRIDRLGLSVNRPTSGCSSCGGMGTAINATTAGSLVSGMAFTIHGVPSGTYTLEAWLDNIGYGAANASNPTGNLSSVAVTSANLSGKAVTLANPAAVSLGTSTPTWDTSEGFGAFNGDAVVGFDKITSNDVEMPASYAARIQHQFNVQRNCREQMLPGGGRNTAPGS